VCDHLGYHISVGKPIIDHRRASDPMTNLVKEAPGIAMNEKFWEYVDDIELAKDHSVNQCMKQIGAALAEGSAYKGISQEHVDYINRLGEGIKLWTELFDE